jgi:hypothetical protein
MSKIMEEVPPMPILDASTTRLEAPQSGNQRKRTVVRTAIIGAVAFTLGATLGVAGSGNAEELDSARSRSAGLTGDLEASQAELADLRTELASRNGEAYALDTQVAGLKSEISRLEGQVSDLKGQVSDLKGKAAAQAQEGGYSVNAESSFEDGIWLVGEEIQPGTYRSPAGGSCYWARLSGFDGFDGIITNGGFTKNQTVTISASDKGFETSSCGTWVKIG